MKKENGITLIALVITVIVLLILAGVTIGLLTGENGILSTAKNAADKYNNAALGEQGDIDNIINMLTNGSEEIPQEPELKAKGSKIEWTASVGGGVGAYEMFSSLVETADGGGIILGNYEKTIVIPKENTVGGINSITIENTGGRNSLIAKFNNDGKLEWIKKCEEYFYAYKSKVVSLKNDEFAIMATADTNGSKVLYYDNMGNLKNSKSFSNNTTLLDVLTTEEDDLVLVGWTRGEIISSEQTIPGVDGIVLETSSKMQTCIIKMRKDGLIKSAKSYGDSDSGIYYTKIIKDNSDGYICFGISNRNLIIPATCTANGLGQIEITGYTYYDNIMVKYNKDGLVEWGKVVIIDNENDPGSNSTGLMNVIKTVDDGYITSMQLRKNKKILAVDTASGANDIYINYESTDMYPYNNVLIKYNKNNKVEWVRSLGKNSASGFDGITHSKDGGVIVAGNVRGGITIPKESTVDQEDIIITTEAYNDLGVLIKVNSSGKVEWGKKIPGERGSQFHYLSTLNDGSYVMTLINFNDQITIPANELKYGNEDLIVNSEKFSGLILKYSIE